MYQLFAVFDRANLNKYSFVGPRQMTQCHTEFLTYPSKTIVRFLNIPFDHVLLGQAREEGEMGNPMLKNVGSF